MTEPGDATRDEDAGNHVAAGQHGRFGNTAQRVPRPQGHHGKNERHEEALPGRRHAAAPVADDAPGQSFLRGFRPVTAQAPHHMDHGDGADADRQEKSHQGGHERKSRVYWVS